MGGFFGLFLMPSGRAGQLILECLWGSLSYPAILRPEDFLIEEAEPNKEPARKAGSEARGSYPAAQDATHRAENGKLPKSLILRLRLRLILSLRFFFGCAFFGCFFCILSR